MTVSGAGFSPVPALDTVRLNGLAAAVLSATYSELTFAVPAGATTGRISVSVGSNAATSAADFMVVSGVEVSDFNPKLGRAGTSLTVTGANFGSTPAANAVSVGGGSATVTSASPSTLLATVGSSATSGKVKVTAGTSTGTSATDFFLLPGSYVPWDVEYTGRLAPGVSSRVAIATAGKAALLLIDAIQGQFLTVYTTGVTFPGSTQLTVYAPGGATVGTSALSYGGTAKLELPVLPATGTYTVAVQPAQASDGQLDIVVWPEATAALAVDGAASPISVSTGQNGRYAFSGTAGDLLSFAATALVTTPPNASVRFNFFKPDGTFFYLYNFSYPSAVTQLPYVLPTTGTYAIQVVPAGTAAASTSVILSRPLTGALPTNGTTLRHQSTRAGQQGRYTFSGTAGQGWALSATTDATLGATITVLQPSGATVVSGSVWANGVLKLDLASLPATGTYTVIVDPSGMATGAADLRLVADATGTLTIGGAAAVLTLLAGQNGRYTFSGNAGDQLGLALTALTTTPSGQYVYLTVYKPDGSGLWSGSASSASAWQLPALATTGTYALKIVPNNTASASLTVMLSRPLTGTIATNGTTTRFQSSRPAQTGRYTFSGTAGKGFTMQLTSNATFTGYVTVNQPSGSTIGSASLAVNTSVKVDLGLLPATGTYTVLVTPAGLATGSLDMRLVAEATGTLTIGAATKTLTLATAQNGRYTFSGTSGDLLSLAVTSLSTVPSGTSVVFTVLKPDGSSLSWNATTVPATWQLPTLPATGTYTLRVLPDRTASANAGVQIPRR